ncbi:hypothetical protein VOLCADRAFT_106732 [Volvox carteri f. nagariensis]|uniref:Uncharacterized protein n=1 Tax=Volvox carteri f. nagariensis TaxID=3068 RepID=D8U9D0_VOLCA|nr:uncharacterized protein VOLCADRAFT_106732 [Volvox carteri f. nagariensis]EFJ43564.1 hypothetical protein VOLCADRAFT_106732 [Volvox carteri f. nagariensis]|eukprot:XP_002955264.1 hypothetical protein VOLCADRAFT_106732 [Volvox carteri f. nagariensis]
MASINNAFALLKGASAAEQQLNKKKKNKKPAANANPSQAAPALAPVAPPPPAPVLVPPVSNDLVIGVNEACAIFERAAREAKTQSDKVKLWKEWTRLASDKASKLKYVDADGVNLDFKQVILRCKALEICAESCISTPLQADKESVLAQMFASFLPNESGVCNALANILLRLSNSLGQDAPDTLGAAQRAVSSLVQTLKSAAVQDEAEAEAANPVAAWLGRVSALDKEIVRQHALLQKLGAANKNVVTRETANTARQLVKLHEEKFDLLQPEAVPVAKPPSGALGACLRSIEELKAVIGAHLKEAELKSGGAAAVDASSRAAQVANYKREEEILATQAAQVSSQIRTLEAQLHSLRAQAAEIEDKRAALAGRQRGVWENGNSAGGKGGRAQAGPAVLTPAHYRDALGLAETLADLADPGRSAAASPEQILTVQSAQVNAPVDYVAAAEHLLSAALGFLGEVPAKLTFCRQRIAQASKLAQLGAVAGKVLEGSKRQAEDAEKLLSDTMAMAEEMVAAASQVRADAHKRYDSMVRFNPEKASVVAAHIRNTDALAAQVVQQYNLILGTANGSAPVVPTVTAPTAAVPVAAVATDPAPVVYTPLVGAPVASASGPVASAASPVRSPAGPGPRTPAPAPATAPKANGGPAATPAPAPVAAPAPRPVPTGPPPRQWAKVETPVVSLAADSSLPTPAEAFKGPSTSAGTSDPDGFKSAGKKNQRKKA